MTEPRRASSTTRSTPWTGWWLLGALAVAVAVAASACGRDAAPATREFDKTVLDTAYRSEGVGVFDVDRDGHVDVVTEQAWWAGPAFTTKHEIEDQVAFDGTQRFAECFGVYGEDVDGDGWTDIVAAPHQGDTMYWDENPGRTTGGADTHWARHVIVPTATEGIETPLVADLFGDGRPVLVMTDFAAGVVAWYAPPAADPRQPWEAHAISPAHFPGAGLAVHGLGVGDVNGDGRLDVLTGFAWFEQTADRAAWRTHLLAFGPNACSRMYTYDVDHDGLADVFCARPHEYGVHWLRQLPRASPEVDPSFEDFLIDGSISELHSLRLDDLDGDGQPELVTGKRYLAHIASQGFDPGYADPALLVYYAQHGDGTFTRHVIDDDSGAGTEFAIADVDGDGRPDVVTANKKGLFLFRRRAP